jgi:hypothetical protein
MKDYQIRVIEEKKELYKKIEKLELFTSSDKFFELSDTEMRNLEFQLDVMILYYKILEARISCF